MPVIVQACRPPLPGSNGVSAARQGPTDSGAAVSDEFSRRTIPVTRGAPGNEEKRRVSVLPPALYEHISWSAPRTLVQNGSAADAMIESPTLPQPGRHRAVTAAAGAAGGHRPPRADAILSGAPAATARRGRVAPLPWPARAGETRQYAQQNAHRRLPPGGNAGRRRPR